jgi:hypothetical protein
MAPIPEIEVNAVIELCIKNYLSNVSPTTDGAVLF